MSDSDNRERNLLSRRSILLGTTAIAGVQLVPSAQAQPQPQPASQPAVASGAGKPNSPLTKSASAVGNTTCSMPSLICHTV
jgi:hypothetical protein